MNVVVASCYGALETVVLGADEKVVIDSGHVVAFDPSAAPEVAAAGPNDGRGRVAGLV